MSIKGCLIFLITCYVLLIFVTCAYAIDNEYIKVVGAGGNAANAGIQLRLRKRGVNHLSDMAAGAVMKAIPKMIITDKKLVVPNGVVIFTNMETFNFRPAVKTVVSMEHPNNFSWTFEDMDISMKGLATGKFGPIMDDGNFNVTLFNMTVTAGILAVEENGQLQLETNTCLAAAKRIAADIDNFQKRSTRLFETFKPVLSFSIKKVIEAEICRFIFQIVDEDVNKELKKAKTMIALDTDKVKFLGSNRYEDSAAKYYNETEVSKNGGFIKNFMSKMYANVSMTKNPKITSSVAEFYIDGEISWWGKGKTPFNPNSLFDTLSDYDKDDRMALFAVSDYVLNSLLYHAYQQDALNFEYNLDVVPSTTSYQKARLAKLRKVIFGAMPEIVKSYPKSTLQLIAAFNQAPYIIMRSGKGIVTINCTMSIVANEGVKNVEVLKTNTAADMEIVVKLKNSMIKGNLTVIKIQKTLISSTIPQMTHVRVKKLANMEKMFIENIVNSELAKGMSMPKFEEVRFDNPIISLKNRKVVIATDFEINKKSKTEFEKNMDETVAKKNQ